MKCTAPPPAARRAISFHAAPSKSRFVSMASLTRRAPCAKTRPAPSALWPTSELPISSSDGWPTAVPCALSCVYSGSSSSASSVGVFAR